MAAQAFGPLGIIGVYGARLENGRVVHAGHVVDLDHRLRGWVPLPGVVDVLDELLLALPRDTPLRADAHLD